MTQHFAAQVLLQPAADAARAQRAFTALGFSLGALVGGSFAIEGDAALFNSVFGVEPHQRADGGVVLRSSKSPVTGGQLPLGALPATLQPLVSAVLFTEPPAFGPGSFS